MLTLFADPNGSGTAALKPKTARTPIDTESSTQTQTSASFPSQRTTGPTSWTTTARSKSSLSDYSSKTTVRTSLSAGPNIQRTDSDSIFQSSCSCGASARTPTWNPSEAKTNGRIISRRPSDRVSTGSEGALRTAGHIPSNARRVADTNTQFAWPGLGSRIQPSGTSPSDRAIEMGLTLRTFEGPLLTGFSVQQGGGF